MRKRMIFAAAIMVPGFLSPVLAMDRQDIPSLSDEQQITAWGAKWKRLLEAGEVEQLRDMYEPDAVLMTNGEVPREGVDAILAFLASNREAGNRISVDFANEQILVDKDRAYLTAKYWMTIHPANGAPVDVRGRSFLVFRKSDDGVWRLWRDIDNQAPDVLAAERPAG